jgi:acetolactate synthase-1/2/3 large subunit
VPTVFITGQVNISELADGRAIRQQGFQETDIVSIVKPITKSAWLIKTVEGLPRVMEQAFYLAVEGRPGPVLIDIPMDVQRMNVDASVVSEPVGRMTRSEKISKFADRVLSALAVAEKPLLLAGGGLRSARAVDEFRILVNMLNIPVVCSLMGLDVLPSDHVRKVGMIGTYGNRWANQALMKSDCLLVLGSRLDVRQTGADAVGFKGSRQIFHVDCDPGQLNNRVTGCEICEAELSEFIPVLVQMAADRYPQKRESWCQWISGKKQQALDTEELQGCKGINPNRFVHALSASSSRAAAILADVGKHQMWVAQSVELHAGQRFLVSGGMGSMGFALPAAIGAALSSGKPVVMVAGDGGMQCNIQELETISMHRLPVKMVVLNNNSLGMVGQFQEDYFESRMQSTIWGYSAPDFEAVAKAYRIDAKTIRLPQEVDAGVEWLWRDPDVPALLNVIIDTDTKIFPKAAYGRPLDDMDPCRNDING